MRKEDGKMAEEQDVKNQNTSIKSEFTPSFTKKDALAAMKADGVFTAQEYNACIRALERVSSEKGVIYRDKYIGIEYRGYEKSQMIGGMGIKIHLIIENRTAAPINLRARILVNGIIVEKDETILTDIPEKSKIIANVAFFFDKLKPIDIKSPADIEEIAFLFRCLGKDYKEINQAKRIARITL